MYCKNDFFIIGYYMILNIVLCAIPQVFVVHLIDPLFLRVDFTLLSPLNNFSPHLGRSDLTDGGKRVFASVSGTCRVCRSVPYALATFGGVPTKLPCFIGATYIFSSCSACDLVGKLNLREVRESPHWHYLH